MYLNLYSMFESRVQYFVGLYNIQFLIMDDPVCRMSEHQSRFSKVLKGRTPNSKNLKQEIDLVLRFVLRHYLCRDE